jgi:hypothetical protein
MENAELVAASFGPQDPLSALESVFQKMFGFSVVSRAEPEIVRLGNGRILVSVNHGSPAGMIDHFAIGIPRFNAESGARYFAQRGATALQGDYAGFRIKDPDGINVQISQR